MILIIDKVNHGDRKIFPSEKSRNEKKNFRKTGKKLDPCKPGEGE